MRRALLWAAAGCWIIAAVVGVARPVVFEPEVELGHREVTLHWIPDTDDPVYTGNLKLFSLGQVDLGEGEVAQLLFPRDGNTLWALGRWGEKVVRLKQNAAGAWQPDSSLDPLPEQIEILSAAIHPLGIMIAAGLSNGDIAVWRPTVSHTPVLFHAHAGACRGLMFKPLASDLDTSFVSVGDDGYWKEWGRPGTLSDSVDASDGIALMSVSVTREGDRVAVGSGGGQISIWPLEWSGPPIPARVMNGHGGRAITGLSFTQTADRLASADEQGGVRVWNTAFGDSMGGYDPTTPSGIRIAYGPREGRYISYAQSDGVIGLLDGYTSRAYQSRDTLNVNVAGFAVSPDGLQGYFGTADGRVEWWYQGLCVPSVATPTCFGGYSIFRGVTPDTTDLELLRTYDFSDSTWGWLSTDTTRTFSDPESIITRGGDTLRVASGPHNGIPYYYSIVKYYWEFLDGGRHYVRRNSQTEGLYRPVLDAEPEPLVARTEASEEAPLLKHVYVVPNPYIENEDLSRFGPLAPPLVRFFNLPAVATIRIYTMNGELVRTLDHPQTGTAQDGGSLAWDLHNDHDETCTSGVYLYAINTPSGEHTTGFLTLVR